MRIVIFNWRDIVHVRAGGAEVATDQLARGLTARGHQVTLFTSAAAGFPAEETRGGYSVVRRGNELTCRMHAAVWLMRHRGSVDVVIDEVNTLPFLSPLIAGSRTAVWMHQLAREVWLSEAPPIVGHAGYLLEPLLLSIYRRRPIVTISQSSAQSFREFGLRGPITVAEIALRAAEPHAAQSVYGRIGYVGRLVPSKRVDDIVRAFARVRENEPRSELYLVGGGPEKYANALRRLGAALGVADGIRMMGRVDAQTRDDVVRSLDVLVMASRREGWGLVVSEAARFGVPSVVYPVPGLVDSVVNGETGLITESPTPGALADALLRVIRDRSLRARLADGAMHYLERFDEERFVGTIERVLSGIANRTS